MLRRQDEVGVIKTKHGYNIGPNAPRLMMNAWNMLLGKPLIRKSVGSCSK